MVIATFRPGTPNAGQTIEYENEVFWMTGGARLTAAQVFEYGHAGQIEWAYEGMRQWVYEIAGAQTPPAATPPGPTFVAGMPPTRGPSPKMSKDVKVAALVGGGVIVLILVLGIVAVAVAPSEKTPAPSQTPVAKVTAKATATTTPSPSSNPTASAAEKKYAKNLATDSHKMATYLLSLSKELANYSGSRNQKLRMVLKMAFIQNVWDRWKHRKAPAPRWKAVHRHWLAGLHYYSQSMTHLAKAMDTNNVSYVTQARRDMNAGKKQIDLANASLETVKAELRL